MRGKGGKGSMFGGGMPHIFFGGGGGGMPPGFMFRGGPFGGGDGRGAKGSSFRGGGRYGGRDYDYDSDESDEYSRRAPPKPPPPKPVLTFQPPNNPVFDHCFSSSFFLGFDDTPNGFYGAFRGIFKQIDKVV